MASDGFQNIIVIEDGEIVVGGSGGGGVTETRVKELIAASIPDTEISVSPEFTSSDQYNQYPTIELGLARCRWLVDNDPTVNRALCRVYSGEYAEEGLVVGNGITLMGDPEARIIGPANPTNQWPIAAPTMPALVIQQGSGQIHNLWIKPQASTAAAGGGIVPGACVVVDGVNGSELLNRGVIKNLNLDIGIEYGVKLWEHGLYMDEQGATASFQDIYNKMLMVQGFYCTEAGFDSTGNPFFGTNCSIVTVPQDSYFFGVNIHFMVVYIEEVVSVLTPAGTGKADPVVIIGDSFMYHVWWAGFALAPGPTIVQSDITQGASITVLNSSVDYATIAANPGDVTFTSATALEQDTWGDDAYSGSGGSRGTLKYALDQQKDYSEKTRTIASRNEVNLSILATAVDFKDAVGRGEFDGMEADDFTSEDFIDAANSRGWELDGAGLARSMYPAIEEDFESYADTAALQAVWAVDGSSNLSNSLITGTDKGMAINFSGASSQYAFPAGGPEVGYVRRSFSSPRPDLGESVPQEIRIRAALTGDAVPIEVRVNFYGSGTRTSSPPWTGGQMRFQFNLTAGAGPVDLTINPSAKVDAVPFEEWSVWDVASIDVVFPAVGPGEAGTVSIYDVKVVASSTFEQEAIIDDFNDATAVGNWSAVNLGATPISTPAVYTSFPRSGAGAMEFQGTDASSTFYFERVFATPVNFTVNDSYVVRLWWSTTASMFTTGDAVISWQLVLEDSAGNQWRLDSCNRYEKWETPPWKPIWWFLGDGSQFAGSGTFDPTDVVRCRISANTPGVYTGSDVTKFFRFDLLEVGKPPAIQLEAAALGDTYSEVSVNATYSKAWDWMIALYGGGSAGQLINLRFDVSRFSNFPWGDDTIFSIGPYNDYSGSRELGTWFALADSVNVYVRVSTAPFFMYPAVLSPAEVCGPISKVDGLALLWRSI